MSPNLIRWSGLAAVLAGILRVITSFMPPIASVALQRVYFTIDALLLVGIIGLYGFQGWWGFFGFMFALPGTGLLLWHDVVNAGALLYPLAAVLFAVGISILALKPCMVRNVLMERSRHLERERQSEAENDRRVSTRL